MDQPRSHSSAFVYIFFAVLLLFFFARSLFFAKSAPHSDTRPPTLSQSLEKAATSHAMQSGAVTRPSSAANTGVTIKTGTREGIQRLGSDDTNVSLEAADQLFASGNASVAELVRAIPEASLFLKGQIVFLLGRIGDRSATPALSELAQYDTNAYIRKNAVEALGKIKDPGSAGVLTMAVRDDDAQVRENAASALGALQDTGTAGALLDRLRIEPDIRVRIAIVKALGQIRSPSATTTLLAELAAQADRMYKNEVVFSLGTIGDTAALKTLQEYLANLKSHIPTDRIAMFDYEQSLQITQEAILKLQKS